MKKIAVLLLFLLIIPIHVSAELSTNLNILTVMNWQTRSLVDRKTYVDADGNIAVPDDKGYATIKYTYKRRQVVKEEFLDENDKLVNCVDGYAYKVNYYNSYYLVKSEYYDVQGNLVNGPDGYASQKISYSQGYHTSTWNYDPEGNPVGAHRVSEYIQYKKRRKLLTSDSWYDPDNHLTPGPDGYARVEYEYEGKTKSKITYIAADGSLFYYAKAGYAKMESAYRGKKILSTYYYGKDNELIAGPDGYAYVLYTYQKEYNTEKYYNADGTPYFTDEGICGIGTVKKGSYQKEQFYFVGEDQRGPCADGYGKTQIYTNSKGKITIQSYYDMNDQLMVVERLGYAKVQYEYKTGKISRTQYFGTDGKLINSAEGYAVVRNTVENKNIIKAEYLDADEKPYYIDGLYNEVQYTWENKQKTAESYWKDGSKASGNLGYHEAKFEYNGAGKESRSMFYDVDGNLLLCNDGYAMTETEYNSKGGVMSKRYYGVDGKLVLAPGKEYAFVKTIPFRDLKAVSLMEEKNEQEVDDDEEEDGEEAGEENEKRETEETEDPDNVVVEYHGLDGKLMNISAGYAYSIREKNEKGFVINEKFYSADGEPAVLPEGYSCVEKDYDEAGNVIAERYRGIDGEPVLRIDGYNEVRREYNNLNQAVRTEYYLEGKLTIIPKGYAIMLREFNEEGSVTAESYYDENERPVLSSAGYHKIERTWLDKKHAASEAWFDTADQPTAPKDTYVKIGWEYDESGNPIVERYYGPDGNQVPCEAGNDETRRLYDQAGQAIRTEYYLNGKLTTISKGYAILMCEYGEDGLAAAESYYDENEKPVLSVSGYHRIVWKWAYKGHPSSEAWFDTDDQPMSPSHDTYVRREREYDEAGNVITERYYGSAGEKIPCAAGYDETRRKYNDSQLPVRLEYYLNGKLSKLPKGYSIMLLEYGDDGLASAESYFDENEKPVLSAAGYHKVVRTWAYKDHPSSESWFDTKNQPMTLNNETFVRREKQYDDAGNVTAELYYGADGEKIPCRDGYDEDRKAYDENGEVVREEYYLDGKLTKTSKGYTIKLYEYGDDGFVAAESYFDENEKPVLSTSGYHKIMRTWAYKDHPSSEAWLDAEGQPVSPNNDSYVRRERDYDKAGNVITERYYGADGNMIPCNSGYDETRRQYNDKKQAIRQEYYLKGKLENIPKGYAVIRYEYGEDGFVASESYFDENEEPVLSTSRYHKIMRTWAYKDHPSSEAWFDVKDQPMSPYGDSYVKREREYDGYGNVITERYYNADGEKIPCNAGYDETRRQYNENRQTIRQEYYLDGKLINLSKGYAIILYEYGENGIVAAESYYDDSEKPVLSASGYHKAVWTWADKDHPSSEAWFDTENRPMALNNTYVRREKEYDDAWNITVERYYGADGEKIPCNAGYDETRRQYNENRQAIRQEYYLNGKLAKLPKGYAIILYEYDEDGFVAVESYYDEDEKPVLSNSGYHKVVRTWAYKDHPSSEAWFDTEGEPTALNNDTYVRREKEYDDNGNVITERYYNADGEKIPCRNGYDEIRKEYNRNGQAIRTDYYLAGEITSEAMGYAIMLREYDEAGLITAESYYNEKREPVLCKSGYHKIVRTWQNKDQETSEAWYDQYGQPTTLSDTYVKVEFEYNEDGYLTAERYFGADGEKIPCSKGFDEIRWIDGEAVYYLNDETYIIPEKEETETESSSDEDAA